LRRIAAGDAGIPLRVNVVLDFVDAIEARAEEIRRSVIEE
jgi:hypothetical protein